MYAFIQQKNCEEKIIDSSEIQVQIKSSEFIDPFFVESKHLGFYSDIYSFGKIL
jgi:hypothetical protein